MIERLRDTLSEAVRYAYEQPHFGTDEWTKAISQSLLDLGHELGFKVCVSAIMKADNPEWLYDMVWYTTRGSGDEERLDDVPMVMECEWHSAPGKISEDFEKLLLANAPMKVMICYPKTGSRDYMIRYFKDSIVNYKRRKHDERYLIAFLRDEHKDCQFIEL